jgi:hypothetical protein
MYLSLNLTVLTALLISIKFNQIGLVLNCICGGYPKNIPIGMYKN